jgi:hypothetical protein
LEGFLGCRPVNVDENGAFVLGSVIGVQDEASFVVE